MEKGIRFAQSPGRKRVRVAAERRETMSSLVHLGRAAITRAQLEAPKEREAARGTLILRNNLLALRELRPTS
jgi:hypothetical protein